MSRCTCLVSRYLVTCYLVVRRAAANELEHVVNTHTPKFHAESSSVSGLKKVIVDDLSDKGEATVLPTRGFCKQFFNLGPIERERVIALSNAHQRSDLVTRISGHYRLVPSMGESIKINAGESVQFTQEKVSTNLANMSRGLAEILKNKRDMSSESNRWGRRHAQRMKPRQIDHERGKNRHGGNYCGVARLLSNATREPCFPNKAARRQPQQDICYSENQGEPSDRIKPLFHLE